MLTVLLACLAMALKDSLGTWLTQAEARNRAVLAGSLDALFDIASIFTYGVAGAEVIKHGLSVFSVVMVAALSLTSFLGTICWVRIGQKWMPSE